MAVSREQDPRKLLGRGEEEEEEEEGNASSFAPEDKGGEGGERTNPPWLRSIIDMQPKKRIQA